MANRTNLLVSLLILISLFSCTEDRNNEAVYITTKNQTGLKQPCKLYEIDLLDYSELPLKVDTLFDPELTMKVELEKPRLLRLQIGGQDQQVFLQPGCDLNLRVIDSLIIWSGEGGDVNNALNEVEEISSQFSNGNAWRFAKPERFLTIRDSLRSKLMEVFGKGEFTATERLVIENEIEMELILKHLEYLLVSGKAHKYYDLPNDLKLELAELFFDANRQSELTLRMARVLDLYVRVALYSKFPVSEGDLSALPDIVKNIESMNFSTDAEELVLAQNLGYWMAIYGNKMELDSLYQHFNTKYDGSKYLNSINDDRIEWGKLAKGKPAPKFEGIDESGDTVRINDFHGQLVYVDIWSTSCKSCIKGFPAFNKLQQDVNKDNVIFLFVSTDRNQKDWLDYIQRRPIPDGNHIWLSNKQSKQLRQNYKMWSVGRYILIDQRGHLIDAMAPHPSSKEIRQLIKS